MTAAFHRETQTIPIVFVIASDPVGDGFIASLARPGGNITGFVNVEATMGGKWLELLREAAPKVTRVALMFNPDTAPGGGNYLRPSFEAAARTLGVRAIISPVRNDAEIEAAIAALGSESGGGLVVMTDSFMRVHRGPIIAYTARHKVPAVHPLRVFALEGGLMAHGPYNTDLFRGAAPYVDLKTAKALGLDIPPTVLVSADEVIE